MEEFFQKENRKTKPNRTENRNFFCRKITELYVARIGKKLTYQLFLCV